MLRRAPVTIGVAVAAIFATLLLGDLSVGSQPLFSWLVHADALHLLTDLVPWLILGIWLEERATSARWLLWTAMGVAITLGLHGPLYPQHSAVYGLSAVNYTLFFAALIAWPGKQQARTDPRRWAMLLLLTAILIEELLHGESAWRSLVSQSGSGPRFILIDHIATTPLLHAAAAIMGATLGLTPGLGSLRHNPQRVRRASEPPPVACR